MPTRRRGKALAGAKAKRTGKANRRGKSSPAVSSSAPDIEIEGILVDEGLTPAQFLFVEELCADPTKPAVEAARKAYPDQAASTHYQTAYENLRKPEIKAAIARRLSPQVHKRRTSTEQVTKIVGEGMYWDPAVIYNEDGSIRPVREWPVEARRQLASIEVNEITVGTGKNRTVIGLTKKVRFASREGYTTLAARINKMLTDRVQHDLGPSLEQLLTKVHKGDG